jgi:hypothetical protein
METGDVAFLAPGSLCTIVLNALGEMVSGEMVRWREAHVGRALSTIPELAGGDRK